MNPSPSSVDGAVVADPTRALDPGERVDRRRDAVPHVIAWNLTRRCNLACAHCYISAGSWHTAEGELATDRCFEIVDQILDVNPAPMLILSGGEPLVRDDLEAIAGRAARGGATVVVGTNGTRLDGNRIRSLESAGVRGFAISIDSLDARYHDRFRHGGGALEHTVAAVDRLRDAGLDFIVQTTVTTGNRGQIRDLAAWSAERGAVAFNVYFLVSTGRGEGMRGLEPAENDVLLAELVELDTVYRGRMMVRAKCQPQMMRHVYEADADSPLLGYATRCPCGVQYCRITPEGKVTPCPYTPVVAGDLQLASFGEVWRKSEVFRRLREGELGGKCGRCEYREVCGGCRARAYADHGDLLAPDDSCAYEPDGFRPLIERRVTVAYGDHVPVGPQWSTEARERIARIPSFVRGVVTSRVEKYAAEHGHDEITLDVLESVRENMPVDFSKRKPFFLGKQPGSR